MYFQLLLVLTGILIIALLVILSIVVSYLSIAQKFKQVEAKLISKSINIADMGFSILLASQSFDSQTQFLNLKKSLWTELKSDLNQTWENAHSVIDFLEKVESKIPKNSDLHLKFKRIHHELYEAVHEYNIEVSQIEIKLQKPFFRLINGLILHIDESKLTHLHEY